MSARSILALGLVLLGGCRLNPECFRSDECAGGQVCVDRVCVPGGASDAGVDGGTPDGGGRDAGADAGQDAGADAGPDAGADAGPDAGTDAGPDGGTDAGCPQVAPDGGPLDDGYAPFSDLLLLHLDEPPGGAAQAPNTAGTGGVASCSGPDCPLPGVCGVYDRAYRFRGAPLEMTQPVFFREMTSSWSVEAWVRPTGTSTGCVFQVVDGASAPVGPQLCIGEDGAPFLVDPARPAGDPRPRGAWQHVAVLRYDDGVYEIFQDGVRRAMGQLGDPAAFASDRLLVGGDVDAARGWQFEGDIDELRVSLRRLFETDLSVNRIEGYLAWNEGGDVWIAPEGGRDARKLVDDARHPRVAPDLSQVAFHRCTGGVCDLWLADRETGVERRLTTTTLADADVASAFSASGTRLYYVERLTCGSVLREIDVAAGGDGAVVRSISGAIVTGLDVGQLDDGGNIVTQVVFSTQPCGGDTFSRVQRFLGPQLSISPVDTVYMSDQHRYRGVRLLYGFPNGYLQMEIVEGPETAERVHFATGDAVPGAAVEMVLRDDAAYATHARRAEWFYFVEDTGVPALGQGLALWDFGTGFGAIRYARTSTRGDISQVDYRSR